KLPEHFDDAALDEAVAPTRTGDSLDQGVRPALEIATPLGLDAQHLRDDDDGYRHRDVGDDVAVVTGAHALHAIGDETANPRLPGGDAPRREAAVDDRAQHVVLRRVRDDEVATAGHLFDGKRHGVR